MKNIKAILLFGSSASEQMDSSSDIDVCIICSGNYDIKPIIKKVQSILADSSDKSIEIADYSEDQFDMMLLKGSLFAHHLKNDGKCVYGKEYLNKKFRSLKSFESFEEELSYYNEIFQQLIESRIVNQNLSDFDYSLVFTLVRNICILLSNFNNKPKFGRRNAFIYCLDKYKNFPVSINTYYFLESKKLCYDRGVENLNSDFLPFDKVESSLHQLIELAKKEFHPKSEIRVLETKIKQFKSLAVFGFKERMSLEKNLFSILKMLTNNKVSGFNDKALIELKKTYTNEKSRLSVILKLFELRNFLKKIASGNAYVRDVALENAATNRLTVFKFIKIQVKAIDREIEKL